jgi:protein-tyrosine phosphatase
MPSILVLCTANICRSVMAQAMLASRLAAQGTPADVGSAGLLWDGHWSPAVVVEVLADRGLDVSGHQSHRVPADDLAAADLIIGLAREHVRQAVVLRPDVWPRAFTLRELVRRGREAGPRGPDQPLAGWLAVVAAGRDRRGLLGVNPADDVADPYGGPLAGYQATARQLDELTAELAALCWPQEPRRAGRPG